MAYIELAILYYLLSLLFIILTLILLKKSTSLINKIFATSTILYFLFGIVMGTQRLELFAPWGQDLLLNLLSNFLFVVAPLGMMFSAYMIVDGEYRLKSYPLWIFAVIYTIAGFLTWIFRFIFPIFDEPFNLNFFNFLINVVGSVPLILSTIQYGRLIRETEQFRNQLYILIVGFIIAIIGLLLFAILALMNAIAFQAGSMVVIVVGLVISIVAFIYRPTTSQNSL
ncbi:MAG: hypothetical protein ACFFBD_05585 [Candidatus Hodarchaeota archaeon]